MAKVKVGKVKPLDLGRVASPNIKSVALPRFLIDAVAQDMDRHGYGPREKSLWFEEALSGLVIHDRSLMLGSTGSKAFGPDDPSHRPQQIKINLRLELDQQCRWLVTTLRRQHPEGDGTFTDIVRFAIVFRLRYPQHFPRANPDIESDALIRAAIEAVVDPVLSSPYPVA